MNLSWLSIIVAFLPQAQAIEQDIEAEVKLLSSTADGKAKLQQSIAILEDILSRAKTALGGGTAA